MNSTNQTKNSTESDKNLFDRILKYTGVFGGVQGVNVLITMVLNIVKSRWLGPVGYGITESLNRNLEPVRSSTNLGIATVAVPVISHAADDSPTAGLERKILLTRSWALLTAILGMIVCLLLAPYLSMRAFDGDRGYAGSFMILSMSVAAAAVTNGETAILKGTGMLRQIALSRLLTGAVSLCVSVPLYWFLRIDGIVLALALSVIGSLCVTCCYSVRRFPYRVRPFCWSLLREGTGMIGFGLFFTVTAFLASLAWQYITNYIQKEGGEAVLGVYSAGYMLVTYFTDLFMAVVESEYFPRLSAAGDDMTRSHSLMNNQSLAMSMLSAPLVILFMLVVPIMVMVVLGYGKFHDSIILAQLAIIGLYFKSVYQPIAFLVTARSDSKVYMIQESLCYILLIICIVTGYKAAGVKGIGAAFAAWELSYLLLVLFISRIRYGFRMDSVLVRNFLILGLVVAVAAAAVIAGGYAGYAVCAAMCVVSAVLSLRFFNRHTTLIPGIVSKFSRK